MISEQKFASSFSSFWSSVTPLMDEFVQVLNDNVLPRNEVPSSGPGNLNALFSEMAFELSVTAYQQGKLIISTFDPKEVVLHSRHRIATFLRQDQVNHDFTPDNVQEITSLATNLLRYYTKYLPKPVSIRPVFRGCGIVSECEGDIAGPKVLVEVKAVRRKIMGADLRQILIYLALMHAESIEVYPRVLLLNPRLGITKSFSAKSLAVEVSGMDLYTLLDEIVLYISDLSNVLVPETENQMGHF